MRRVGATFAVVAVCGVGESVRAQEEPAPSAVGTLPAPSAVPAPAGTVAPATTATQVPVNASQTVPPNGAQPPAPSGPGPEWTQAPTPNVPANQPIETPPRERWVPYERPGPCGCVWPPNAFRHDGYYERVGLGLHYFSMRGSGPSGSASISGFGTSFTGAFGGTPWSGLVIAGAVEWMSGSGSFNGSPAGAPGHANVHLPGIDVLVDWYPNPRDGWHGGATFGFGGYVFTDSRNRNYVAVAPAGSLFGGVSSWFGAQYSGDLSAVLSLSAPASGTDQNGHDTGYRFMSVAFGFEYSIVYN